jgi:hypothetical protein
MASTVQWVKNSKHPSRKEPRSSATPRSDRQDHSNRGYLSESAAGADRKQRQTCVSPYVRRKRDHHGTSPTKELIVYITQTSDLILT